MRRTEVSARAIERASSDPTAVKPATLLNVDTAFGSDEPDAHSTHTEHDHRRNDPGDDRTADHESVGERLADAMRHNDCTRPRREMREDEEHAEPIMRHEADVPRVLYEAGWRARGETPPGVDAKICPCENEDRVHVAQHVKGEIDARRDLEGAAAPQLSNLVPRFPPISPSLRMRLAR